eukprot:s1546_g10.t1
MVSLAMAGWSSAHSHYDVILSDLEVISPFDRSSSWLTLSALTMRKTFGASLAHLTLMPKYATDCQGVSCVSFRKAKDMVEVYRSGGGCVSRSTFCAL